MAGNTVGVLALQGGFAAHARSFEALGCSVREVRRTHDLEGLDALALPGGESTVQDKLVVSSGLRGPLDGFVASGKPVLATCAGLILSSRYGWLDIQIQRNAYGRQINSFEARSDTNSAPGFDGLPLIFIRAPRIQALGSGVEVLARFDGEPVLVRQGNVVGACFHPELTGDLRIHRCVLSLGSAQLMEVV